MAQPFGNVVMSQLVPTSQVGLVRLKIEPNALAEALNFPIFAARFKWKEFLLSSVG